MSTPVRNIYNCAQEDLYTATDNLADSLTDTLPDFTKFSPVYTSAFLTGFRKQITDARSIEDYQTRDEKTETQRITLQAATTEGLNLWQTFKRYAEKTWKNDPDTLKAKLEAAGSKEYEKAAAFDWKAGATLFSDILTCIANNQTALAPFMSADFQKQMTESKTKIEDLYKEFIRLTQQKGGSSNDKITANNTLYDAAIEICKDGQLIFRNTTNQKDLFTWDTILSIISKKQTEFKGYIKDSITNLPIEGAEIAAALYNKITGKDGYFDFKQIAADTYEFKILKSGYQPLTVTVTLEPGVAKTLTITLTPIVP